MSYGPYTGIKHGFAYLIQMGATAHDRDVMVTVGGIKLGPHNPL